MVDHARHDSRRDAADHLHDVRSDAIERMYDGNGRAAWGAIFAGTVVALGIFVLLSLAGIGLGLTIFEATDATPMNGSLTTTAIWQFVSQLVALFVGGYTAGRLAGVIHSVGSMLHGLTVWALATLAGVWFATQAVTGLAGAAGSALSGLASGASSAASAVIPDDLSLPDLSLPNVSLDALPQDVQATLRENGITPENFQAEAQEAFRDVISEQEQATIREDAVDTVTTIVRNPADADAEIEAFIDGVFGAGGVLSEEDGQEALDVMQERFGLSEQQAEQYLESIAAEAQSLQAEAEAAIEDARAQAIEAADAAADAAATAAWLAALASLIGLVAAVGGAAIGRPARG